jgi:hypothetical protein
LPQGGFPTLSSAEDLATEYLNDQGFATHDARVDSLAKQVPGRALVEVKRRIGLRLLPRAGGRGVARFPKAIPVVGGVAGGAFDGWSVGWWDAPPRRSCGL